MSTSGSTDESMHHLLPWYVAGTLATDERDAFERHLAACESCRDERGVLEQALEELKRHGTALLEGHPDAEQIVAAARGELDGPESTAVARHVALCEACASETRWVRGEASAGVPDATAATVTSAVGAGWRHPALGWAAAAAALLALLVVLPGRNSPTMHTGLLTQQFIIPVERAAGIQNQVRLERDQPGINVLLEVDLPTNGFPFDLRWVDAEGRIVMHERGIERGSLVDDLYLSLSCARDDCPPGRYEIELFASGASAASIELGLSVVGD